MSEINAPATLTTPGGVITFNPAAATAPYYFFNDVKGLDQAPLRVTRDKKPQADGAIQYPSLRGERLITFDGLVVATSATERNQMCAALKAALESIENADGTYEWTETGMPTQTVTVRSDIAVIFTGKDGPLVKQFTFGLVAADPAIS